MDTSYYIGNLTNDVTVMDTKAGKVSHFTIAVNKTTRTGEKKVKYIKVSAFGTTGENAARYLAKGSKVAVTGSVTATAYINKEGKAVAELNCETNMIEFLSSRKDTMTASATTEYPEYDKKEEIAQVDDDEDILF